MKKIALTGLAAAAMLVGIGTAVAAAPGASAATLPSLPATVSQLARTAELQGAAHGSHKAADGSITSYNDLFGDWCLGPTFCMAVGYNGYSTPDAQVFNGGGWSEAAGTIPVPAGTTTSALQSVACRPNAAGKYDFCMAVGQYVTGTSGAGNINAGGLAEVWNGTSWTDAQGLTPGGAYTGLAGVSCPNPTQCVAVGTVSADGNSGTPVADAWNGSSWVRTPTPVVPTGAFLTALTGVSCWTGTTCIASGFYETGTEGDPTGEGPLAEEWNGKTWTSIRPPRTGLESWLNGIQCLSATSCTVAGGYYGTDTHYVGFTEQWNGKSWTADLSPSLGGQGNSQLLSVSCLTWNDCNAVGMEHIDGTAGNVEYAKAAAVHWNGVSLGLTSPGGISGEDDILYGVSCKQANFCAGVGIYGPADTSYSADISWFWNTQHWKLVSVG